MIKPDLNKIQMLLKQELEHKGIRQLRRDIGLSPATLYNFLDMVGNPKTETIDKLSKYFKKPVDFFYYEELVQEAKTPSLSNDESKLISLYRSLDDIGHGQELIDFAEFALHTHHKEILEKVEVKTVKRARR